MNRQVIPEAAIEAAADVFGHITGTHSPQAAEAILEAALPTLLSHEREETRLAHIDAVVNAAAVDRLERELERRDSLDSQAIVAELRLFNHNEAADLIEGWHRK